MATTELERIPEFVEYEIECPRCYGMMALCSEDDVLMYTCEDCDFILHTTRNKERLEDKDPI